MTSKTRFLTNLDAKEIIQINATVIAGLLILLGLSDSLLPTTNFQAQPPQSSEPPERLRYEAELQLMRAEDSNEKLMRVAVTTVLMSPFVASAFLALTVANTRIAIGAMAWGFLSLIAVFIYVSYINFNFSTDQLKDAIEKFNDAREAALASQTQIPVDGELTEQELTLSDDIVAEKN